MTRRQLLITLAVIAIAVYFSRSSFAGYQGGDFGGHGAGRGF